MPTFRVIGAARVAALAAVCAGGLTAGCAHRPNPATAGLLTGYIVANRDGRELFGLDRDTLPEIEAARVPPPALESAYEYARLLRKSFECNRYFTDGARILVYFASSCRTDEYLEDGVALAAFDRAGRQVGIHSLWPSDLLYAIEPVFRLKDEAGGVSFPHRQTD